MKTTHSRGFHYRSAYILEASVRGVAQPGSATVLGTVGRKFESCRPDHFPISQTYISQTYIFQDTNVFKPLMALRL